MTGPNCHAPACPTPNRMPLERIAARKTEVDVSVSTMLLAAPGSWGALWLRLLFRKGPDDLQQALQACAAFVARAAARLQGKRLGLASFPNALRSVARRRRRAEDASLLGRPDDVKVAVLCNYRPCLRRLHGALPGEGVCGTLGPRGEAPFSPRAPSLCFAPLSRESAVSALGETRPPASHLEAWLEDNTEAIWGGSKNTARSLCRARFLLLDL